MLNVVRNGVWVSLTGVVVGILPAATLSYYLSSTLFGLTPWDGRTYAAVAAAFVLISAVACYLPARRATQVDPVTALRTD